MDDAVKFNDATMVGIPTMALLPSNNFYFQVSENKYKIVVPRKGKYVDLDPKVFSEEDGEFEIINDGGTVVNIGVITRVLFATHRYPSLKKSYLFCPLAIAVNEDDQVEIYGQVVNMLEAPIDLTVKKDD